MTRKSRGTDTPRRARGRSRCPTHAETRPDSDLSQSRSPLSLPLTRNSAASRRPARRRAGACVRAGPRTGPCHPAAAAGVSRLQPGPPGLLSAPSPAVRSSLLSCCCCWPTWRASESKSERLLLATASIAAVASPCPFLAPLLNLFNSFSSSASRQVRPT